MDFLKIDGVFVEDIANDPVSLAMVSSISDVGHVMGMETIAEFVENDQILAKLRAIGVNYAKAMVEQTASVGGTGGVLPRIDLDLRVLTSHRASWMGRRRKSRRRLSVTGWPNATNCCVRGATLRATASGRKPDRRRCRCETALDHAVRKFQGMHPMHQLALFAVGFQLHQRFAQVMHER
ncbi:MAG: EAL domain-containing protein [Candidatus Competibacteraceae bacterium]